MSKILSRCQKALESQMIDMQISLNKHKSMMKKTFGISSTAGAMAALTSLAFASGPATGGDVAQFGTQIGTALGNIYDTAFKVITAAAALGDRRDLLFYRGDVPPAGNFLPIAAESYQRTPAETHGFCTSFVICKSCYLKFAEAGNWSASTHAAAALGG
mgnify:CR=1 FL=1